MIEIPEAVALSKQLNDTVRGRSIASAQAGASPHKFAWFRGDPAGYGALLYGRTVGSSRAVGGMVEVSCGEAVMVFTEGIALRFLNSGESRPKKHQLLLEFEDGSALSASVRMYGGLLAARREELDDPYYIVAGEKPSPLSEDFDFAWFSGILDADGAGKLSAKALLATEQRIPGLGNGVLQDILHEAGIHPKRKAGTFTGEERSVLYNAVRTVLASMADKGGRDTEADLFGRPGGYTTKMSRNTVGRPCSRCGTIVEKASYMGGSVYFCPGCQSPA